MKNVLLLPLLIGVTITSLLEQAPQVPPAPQVVTPGEPVTPPRAGPRPATPEKGTAIIRGTVSSDDGSPVRRAEVRAAMVDFSRVFLTASDAEGRFELPDLPAGRYALSASRTGYLSPGAAGYQNVPPAIRLEVADRQEVGNVQLLLSKGAVITGRIVDDLGDPAMHVEVQALRFAYRDGVRQLSRPQGALSGSQRTDDLGQFRLFGLASGEYFVTATPQRPFPISGPQLPPRQGAALTYFPGTQDIAEARRVRVVAGKETGPISFALGTTRLARIRGQAFSASGTPLIGSVSIDHRDPIAGRGFGSGSSAGPEGSFEFTSLSPGVYILTAKDGDGRTTTSEQGSIRITVAGEDIEGLTIFTAKEAILRGRIVTDDDSPLPQSFRLARINAEAMDPAEESGPPQGAQVNEDGAFEIKGLFGRRRFLMSRVSDWQMRATRVNGEDVIDTGIEFKSGQVIEDVEIVVSRNATTLGGTVTDRLGQPVARATVVLFIEEERQWTPRSRFVRMGVTGETGSFRVNGAPPSDLYLAVAVTGIEDGQWLDPEFLRSVKHLGTRVRLADGESKMVELKVAEGR